MYKFYLLKFPNSACKDTTIFAYMQIKSNFSTIFVQGLGFSVSLTSR